MKRGRSAQVVRLWRVLLALDSRRANGLSLTEARAVCGEDVSERTIRRDFDALSEVFPIEPAGPGRFRLNLETWSFELLRQVSHVGSTGVIANQSKGVELR